MRPFIAFAIESILGQDYAGEIEIIAVDDGSTISRYGVKDYDKHFIWKFYAAERLIAQQ